MVEEHRTINVERVHELTQAVISEVRELGAAGDAGPEWGAERLYAAIVEAADSLDSPPASTTADADANDAGERPYAVTVEMATYRTAVVILRAPDAVEALQEAERLITRGGISISWRYSRDSEGVEAVDADELEACRRCGGWRGDLPHGVTPCTCQDRAKA